MTAEGVKYLYDYASLLHYAVSDESQHLQAGTDGRS